MAEVFYNKLVAFLLKDGNSLFKEEGVLKSIVELNVAESARIMEEHRTLLRMLLQRTPSINCKTSFVRLGVCDLASANKNLTATRITGTFWVSTLENIFLIKVLIIKLK
jgi:hypothetical protein